MEKLSNSSKSSKPSSTALTLPTDFDSADFTDTLGGVSTVSGIYADNPQGLTKRIDYLSGLDEMAVYSDLYPVPNPKVGEIALGFDSIGTPSFVPDHPMAYYQFSPDIGGPEIKGPTSETKQQHDSGDALIVPNTFSASASGGINSPGFLDSSPAQRDGLVSIPMSVPTSQASLSRLGSMNLSAPAPRRVPSLDRLESLDFSHSAAPQESLSTLDSLDLPDGYPGLSLYPGANGGRRRKKRTRKRSGKKRTKRRKKRTRKRRKKRTRKKRGKKKRRKSRRKR